MVEAVGSDRPRPVSVSAARRALTTAALVASTVASNSGDIRLSSTIRT